MIKLIDLKGVDTSKRDHYRRWTAVVRHNLMLKDKRECKQAKEQMKHKPYACDLGGGVDR